MNFINVHEVQIYFAIGFFAVGLMTFATGVVILVTKVLGPEMKTIASETAKLAQKGLAEELSGLVGNASTLLTAMNDLVHTARRIAVLLMVTGLLLMAGSAVFILQIR